MNQEANRDLSKELSDFTPPRSTRERFSEVRDNLQSGAVYVSDITTLVNTDTVRRDMIYVTSDYEPFLKNLDALNRPVTRRKDLLESMKKHGYISGHPVSCYVGREEGSSLWKLVIIDGQHRAAAAALAKVPIYFVITKLTDMGAIATINSSSKNWRLDDYANYFIEHGNVNYEEFTRLRNYARNVGLGNAGSSPLIDMLMHGCAHPSSQFRQSNLVFRNGGFKSRYQGFTKDVLDAVVMIKDSAARKRGESTDEVRYLGNREYLYALSFFYWQNLLPEFSFDFVVAQCIKNAEKLGIAADYVGAIAMVESAVNYRRRRGEGKSLEVSRYVAMMKADKSVGEVVRWAAIEMETDEEEAETEEEYED